MPGKDGLDKFNFDGLKGVYEYILIDSVLLESVDSVFLSKLRSKFNSEKIIGLSNRVDIELKNKLKLLSVDEVIHKPVRMKSLRKLMEKSNKKSKKVKAFKNQLPPMDLLLVEDNIVNQKLISRMLQSFKNKVDIAGNGKIALSMIQNKAYDIIFMDMQMPEMDGCTATDLIRNKLRLETPIIALTANTFTDHKEMCLEVGMSDFMSKPIRKELLWKMLNKYSQDIRGDMENSVTL